ncbi:hypothetical protein [Variovorax sp. YR752]|uniref:hypothetical protein n=1 Tax=Variovorax sp. YR752 TaxID=1884383 RepID=UPI0031381B41
MSEHQRDARVPPSVGKILGLDPDGIGSVSIEDIVGSAPAVKMLVHQYYELEKAAERLRLANLKYEEEISKRGENELLRNSVAALEQQLSIYEDFERAYANKKWAARLGAFMQLVSSVAVGIGVNLSTPTPSVGGVVLIALGVVIAIVGIYAASKG